MRFDCVGDEESECGQCGWYGCVSMVCGCTMSGEHGAVRWLKLCEHHILLLRIMFEMRVVGAACEAMDVDFVRIMLGCNVYVV